MRLLLDTHVAIWSIGGPKRLPREVQDLLSDSSNEIYVSAATVWEIAIKHAAGRRGAPGLSGADATRYFRESGYTFLDVTAEHAVEVERLPLIHGDPFDRLLVAQALSEPLRLVTRDRAVAAYSDTIIAF
jgi:PIN domain nuclease of toxin-antitoxin system